MFFRFLYFLFPLACFSQEFSPNLQAAYQNAFALKINTAKEQLKQDKSDNAYKIYVENYVETLELMISENEVIYEKNKNKEEKRLEILETLPESPHKRFLQAEIRLHWALLKLRFGHDVLGAWSVIKAYRLLDENQRLFPNFLPNKKSLGALHILIGTAPENYNWVLKVLNLTGNIKLGQQELNEVTQKDKIWTNEATWIQFYLQGYVLRWSDDWQRKLKTFVEANQDNLSVNWLAVAVSIKNNRSEVAQVFLHNRPKGSNYLAFPLLQWYQGEIALQKSEYATASQYFTNYLKQHQGKSFLKETYLKLFYCSYLNNAQNAGYLQQVLRVGNTIAEADKAAQRFAEEYHSKQKLPNAVLLKARFAFDGGFYQEAYQYLSAKTEKYFSEPAEKAEFNYRLGRIEHKLNKTNPAITHFERGIALGEALPDVWIAAGSALQLGYLYQEKGQKALAKKYFLQTISYKRHLYKNSYDNKAKAGL